MESDVTNNKLKGAYDFIAPVKISVRRKTQLEEEILKSLAKLNLDGDKSILKIKTVSTKDSNKIREKTPKKVRFKIGIQEVLNVTSYRRENRKNNFNGLNIKLNEEENEQQSCTCVIF